MDNQELLEDRVSKLEFQMQMLREFIDPQDNPFSFLVLESGMTSTEMRAIFDLMEEVANGIRSGNPIEHHEFEARVYNIVPSRKGNYHFAESIVRTLRDRSRYTPVFLYMKKSGMNI